MDRSTVYKEDGTVSEGAAQAALPHTNLVLVTVTLAKSTAWYYVQIVQVA